jgi:MFS family permease
MDVGAGGAAVVAGVVPVVLAWLMRRSAQQRAEERDGEIVFRGSTLARVMVVASMVLFPVVAVVCIIALKPGDRWISLLFLGFAVMGAFGTVPTLTVDRHGVRSEVWWRKRQVAWPEIAQLAYNQRSQNFVVKTHGGQTITCSGLHTESHRFREQVLRHTGLPLLLQTPGLIGVNTLTISNADALRQALV